MKRVWSFIICMTLIFSVAASFFTAYAVSLQVDHYKYLNLYDDDSARPDEKITRGELANAVFNLLQSDDKKLYTVTKAPFSDVSVDHIYAKPISYLAYRGHILGYPDSTYKPEGTLTRAEFATIIKRIKRLVDTTDVLKVPDIEGHWALGPINSVIIKGYMKGYPDKTFKPDRELTRAEVASALNNIYERKPNFTQIIRDPVLAAKINSGEIRPIEFKAQVFSDLPKEHWAYADMMEACISHRVYWDRVGNFEIWIKLLDDGYTYSGPAN